MNKPPLSTPAAGSTENLNKSLDKFLVEQTTSQFEEKSEQNWPLPPGEEGEEVAMATSVATQLNGGDVGLASASEQTSETASDTIRGRPLGQILILLVVAVLLVNVPIGYRRAGLVQSVPDATAVVIYDGMVLKGSGPEIYILENHKLRQFDSQGTFNYFRKRYGLAVHIVTDDLLTQFERGRPIRRLVTCKDWSDVYALENGQKRRVEALPFSNPGSSWDSVGQVTCNYLRDIPTGPSFFGQ